MPSFTTPEPITVTVEGGAGNVDVIAGERGDTVVEVAPRDPGKKVDVEDAENTRVEYTDGQLRITVPQQPKWVSKVRTVDITVQLPTGSTVRGHLHLGEFTARGQLAECAFATESGSLTVDAAANADLKTALGDIVVGRLSGSATAETSKGNVRILEAATGTVTAKTAYGHIDIGVSKDSGVQLITQSQLGRVTNGLNDGHEQRSQTVAIDARTSYGDIDIHRSTGDTTVVRS